VKSPELRYLRDGFWKAKQPSLYFKKQVSLLIFGIKIALKAHGV